MSRVINVWTIAALSAIFTAHFLNCTTHPKSSLNDQCGDDRQLSVGSVQSVNLFATSYPSHSILSAPSLDLLVDQIEVYDSGSACARTLGGDLVCTDYNYFNFFYNIANSHAFKVSPSISCENVLPQLRACTVRTQTKAYELLRSRLDSLDEFIGAGLNYYQGPTACAVESDTHTLVCWSNELNNKTPRYYPDLICPSGNCEQMCAEGWSNGEFSSTEPFCWGVYGFTGKKVIDFDGYCALTTTGEVLCNQQVITAQSTTTSYDDLGNIVDSTPPPVAPLYDVLLPQLGTPKKIFTQRGFVCALDDTGVFKCNFHPDYGAYKFLQLPAEFKYDEVVFPWSSFTDQPLYSCGVRSSDKHLVCVGQSPLQLSQDCVGAACGTAVSEMALHGITTGAGVLCALDEASYAVCWYVGNSQFIQSNDPFAYSQRQNADGLLLRDQVRCNNRKCISAEPYTAISLAQQVDDLYWPHVYPRDDIALSKLNKWAGCVIRTNNKPHCFGMNTGSQQNCYYPNGNDCQCTGRIF